MRVPHLLDFIEADKSGSMLKQLNNVAIMLANGKEPSSISQFLLVVGLEKESLLQDGLIDLRPIAVREIFRRFSYQVAGSIG